MGEAGFLERSGDNERIFMIYRFLQIVALYKTNTFSINNVNGGNPLGVDAKNPQFYRDNDNGSICTELDGLTVVLDVETTVTAHATNHIKIAIAVKIKKGGMRSVSGIIQSKLFCLFREG